MSRFPPSQHFAGRLPPDPEPGADSVSAHPRQGPDSPPSGTPRRPGEGVARGSPTISSLHIRHATVAFAGQDLFRDLSLELPAGRWTCILGPSGVGKSSLLRLIAGLIPPQGATRLDWQPLAPPRLSFLAQTDLLLPWLSALDNVLLGPRLRRVSAVEMQSERQRALALLQRLGLERSTTSLPATLSGGMRQRVALARTLLEDAPTVLMDEPFSQLDAITRHDLQALAAQLFSDRTVVLVTHDPQEALRLGHRVVVLAGRPAQVSSVLELDGAIPREIDDLASARLHAELMRSLHAAAERSA